VRSLGDDDCPATTAALWQPRVHFAAIDAAQQSLDDRTHGEYDGYREEKSGDR
jgi:hypothetical protein